MSRTNHVLAVRDGESEALSYQHGELLALQTVNEEQ
jgi:hypothetical protein